MEKKIVLKDLKAEYFMHPGDKMAIEKLQEYTTFKKFMERLLVEGLEEDIYLISLADNVNLGPKQGKKVYDVLIDASKILNMEPPELFMDTNPVPNAFAFGEKKPIITLTSGLIDTFSDEEIFAVIGHELGHIKCRHTLYSLMAQNIQLLLQMFSLIPLLGPVIGVGVYLSLLAWYRRSELSADRAALLATQSKELVTKTMMKLAGGGSNRIYETLSQESFLEQADKYEKLQKEMMDSKGYKKWAYFFGTLMATAFTTHPWPALRTKEAIRFYESERYKNIISRNYPDTEEKAEGIFTSEGISVDIDFADIKQDISEVGRNIKEKTTGFGGTIYTYLKEKIENVAEDIEKEKK